MQAAVSRAIYDFTASTRSDDARAGTFAAVKAARAARVSSMTQPLCQVCILTPENGWREYQRALLDQAEPDLLRTACHDRRKLPLPDARDGGVFLIDHLSAAGSGDGQGLDPAGGEKEDRHGGPGLRMINYRANRTGGTLTVQPGPGGVGTLVAGVFDRTQDQDRFDRTA